MMTAVLLGLLNSSKVTCPVTQFISVAFMYEMIVSLSSLPSASALRWRIKDHCGVVALSGKHVGFVVVLSFVCLQEGLNLFLVSWVE